MDGRSFHLLALGFYLFDSGEIFDLVQGIKMRGGRSSNAFLDIHLAVHRVNRRTFSKRAMFFEKFDDARARALGDKKMKRKLFGHFEL